MRSDQRFQSPNDWMHFLLVTADRFLAEQLQKNANQAA